MKINITYRSINENNFHSVFRVIKLALLILNSIDECNSQGCEKCQCSMDYLSKKLMSWKKDV